MTSQHLNNLKVKNYKPQAALVIRGLGIRGPKKQGKTSNNKEKNSFSLI